ncbi:hypothetical protein LZ318_37060 [Saccharopolyspora indica]|uniref:hypothetical protein n=1 Tax=Saccharopolyspora indica TaxID=1229659 RepID=UPI0022EA6B03|nr:hypothetical protein [Saccharopolyspora indica]MDA3647770.1 hypothetical protein [Saccharopolyspora indica]
MTFLDVALAPNTYFTIFVVSAAVLGILALTPIRGGNGQHAGAGPGTVMVWQLREALAAEPKPRPAVPAKAEVESSAEAALRSMLLEEIRWPEQPVAEYVGRHRLRWDIDEHPPCPVDLRLSPGFAWSEAVSGLGCHSAPNRSRVSGGTGR